MNIPSWLRKNWQNLFLAGFVLLMLLYAPAKVWMLQRLMSTGMFNASFEEKRLKAQSISFRNIEGETFTTESLKGKLVFINFWATWCPPCLAELPSIQNLYDRYKDDKRVVFIMADVDNKLELSNSFLLTRSLQMPVYAPASEIDPMLYNGTLPTTIILDKDGMIMLSHSGIGRYDTPATFALFDAELNR